MNITLNELNQIMRYIQLKTNLKLCDFQVVNEKRSRYNKKEHKIYLSNDIYKVHIWQILGTMLHELIHANGCLTHGKIFYIKLINYGILCNLPLDLWFKTQEYKWGQNVYNKYKKGEYIKC